MKWIQAALLLPIALLGSCASEGGSRGSGITTLVQGNVERVQRAALSPAYGPKIRGILADLFAIEGIARARTELEGIQVAIEGTELEGETDANGRFMIQGAFGGPVTLIFRLPDEDGSAQIAINVPDAGLLTLSNVGIDVRSGAATAERQDVEFEGIVTGTACADATIALVSSREIDPDHDEYTVRLDTSLLRDTNGNALDCSDLQGGERAFVQGTVNPDGTFGHAIIQLVE